MSFSNKISTGILLAILIIIGLTLVTGGKAYDYLGFAPPPPQVIAKPTEECPPGSSFIPDQGCTMPLEVITPTLTTSASKPEPLIAPDPNPLVVWIEEELSWKVSPGSPEFALYDNGLLIFRNPKVGIQELNQYLSVLLSEAEWAQLGYTLLSSFIINPGIDQGFVNILMTKKFLQGGDGHPVID